ncbi:MAG: protoporphyrinogen oxidase HemJ [Gammaproteobacteria bacterium]|nr:MAG: protoporphyrinogen oxidase HemJ [Gammaproteobacteria bacterium]
MLWIKALHIFFMVSWFAGLFYLPRLFVHHAMTEDAATSNRLKIMERKLYFFITPWAILTILTGLWLWLGYGFSGTWLSIKIILVVLLIVYHIVCGFFLVDFREDRNKRSDVFYRWFNELPVFLLLGIIFLVVTKQPA